MEDDSAAWRLSPVAAVVLALLPIVAGGLIGASQLLVKPVYRFLTDEDSVLEWSQFGLVVIAAVLLTLLAIRLARRRDRLWALLFGLAAVALWLVAGEEISWGQRLLGIETPPAFADSNTQGELTLHNVEGVLRPLNTLLMLGAGVASALPLLAVLVRGSGRRLPALAYRVIPPLALVPAFGIFFAYRFMRFVRSGGTSGSFAEFIELSLYFGVAAFAWLLLRRITAERT